MRQSRVFLMIATLLILMTLSLPNSTLGANPKSHAGEKLVVATWGGDWRAKRHMFVGEKIEEMTGAKVEYIVGNPRDHLARLVAGRGAEPQFDVIEMEESVPIEAGRAGFLEPLSPERIPNMKSLPDALVQKDSVAFLLLEYGIAYNTEKFKELGLPKPTRWNDLFNPKLAGHVTIPDLNVSVGLYAFVGLALEGGGSERNVEPAWDKLPKLKVLYYYRSSSDLATRFTSGDVWAAAWHNSRTYRLANTGFPVSYANAEVAGKKGMAGFDWLGIVKGTRHKELAEMWINLSLDPKVQYEMGKWGVVGPTNRNAQKLFEADATLSERVSYRPDDVEKFYTMDWEIVVDNVNNWIDTWNRVVTKK